MALSVFYQNVRGLRSKLNEFKIAITANNHDIIFVSESWLNNDIFDSEVVDVCEYTLFRRDRSSTASLKTDGGGVFIAVRSSLRPSLVPDFQSEAEDIWVQVIVDNMKIFLCCVYIPPVDINATVKFVSKLCNIKNRLENNVVLLIGDFNCSTVTWVCNDFDNSLYPINVEYKYEKLIDAFSFLELMQFNKIVNSNNKILDLILSNTFRINNVKRSDSPLVREDDHHPSLELLFDFKESKHLHNRQSFFYNYKRANYESINQSISDISWENLLNKENVNNNLDVFYEILNAIIDSHVPKIKKKKNYPIYFSNETIRAIKYKNKFHKRWKIYKNLSDHLKFIELRARSKRLIKSDFNRYTLLVQSELTSNPKKLFKFVSVKNKNHNYPSIMTYNGTDASTGEEISELFAEYFRGVYVQPITGCLTGGERDSFVTNCSHVLSGIHLSTDSVEEALLGIDANKGAGPDQLPSFFVNACSSSLKIPLSIIFNQSLSSGIFPNIWKVAAVVPVHKSGVKSLVNNYRPISKLCIFEKIFESLVYPHLLYIVKTQIIPEQHGFFRGRSIETNLINFVEYLQSEMDQRVQVDVVYADFSKAFDKINIELLILRLEELGVCGVLLRWFQSYLSNRSQYVSVESYKSKLFHVNSGVPQGSHLGPLLFIIYINNIGKCFQNCRFLLYADDLKIFRKVENLQDCINIQMELDKLTMFAGENNLFLNHSKCSVVSFTRNRTVIHYPYSFDDTVLTRVGRVRDLGVIFDSKLLFDAHIDFVSNSCNKMLGYIMRQCRFFNDRKTIIALYYAFIFSRLNFGSSIWSPQYGVYVARLENIQKKFLRFLSFKCNFILDPDNPDNHSTRLRHFGIMRLENCRIINDILFMYKLFNGLYESEGILQNIFLNTPPRRLRQHEIFCLPFRNTNCAKNSPLCRIVRYCNVYKEHIDIFSQTKSAIRNGLRRIFQS